MPTDAKALAAAIAAVTGDPDTPPDVKTAVTRLWGTHRETIVDLGADAFRDVLSALRAGKKDAIAAQLVASLSAAEIVAALKKQTARLKALRAQRDARLKMLGDVASTLGKVGLNLLLAALG